MCRQLLLDGFFEDGAAHDGAGGEEAVEVAAGGFGFVEVAISFFGAGRGDDTLRSSLARWTARSTRSRSSKTKAARRRSFCCASRAPLDVLPCEGGRRLVIGLEANEGSEPLACVLNEAMAHLVGELLPIRHGGGGIFAVASAQLSEDDFGQDSAVLGKPVGAR